MNRNLMFALALLCSPSFTAYGQAEKPPLADQPTQEKLAEKESPGPQQKVTVLIVTVDDQGKLISSETMDFDQPKGSKPKTFRFDSQDGKLKIIMPDGGIKVVKPGKAVSDKGVSGVIRLEATRFDDALQGQVTGRKVIANRVNEELRSQLDEAVKQLAIASDKINTSEIADKLQTALAKMNKAKAEMNKAKAGLRGEMVVRLGDVDVIELSGSGKIGDNEASGEDKSGIQVESAINDERPEKQQIRVTRVIDRVDTKGDVLNKIFSKLEQLSDRLERLESKLDPKP